MRLFSVTDEMVAGAFAVILVMTMRKGLRITRSNKRARKRSGYSDEYEAQERTAKSEALVDSKPIDAR